MFQFRMLLTLAMEPFILLNVQKKKNYSKALKAVTLDEFIGLHLHSVRIYLPHLDKNVNVHVMS